MLYLNAYKSLKIQSFKRHVVIKKDYKNNLKELLKRKHYQDKAILTCFSNMHKEKLDFGKYSLIKAHRLPNRGIIAMLNKKVTFKLKRRCFYCNSVLILTSLCSLKISNNRSGYCFKPYRPIAIMHLLTCFSTKKKNIVPDTKNCVNTQISKGMISSKTRSS